MSKKMGKNIKKSMTTLSKGMKANMGMTIAVVICILVAGVFTADYIINGESTIFNKLSSLGSDESDTFTPTTDGDSGTTKGLLAIIQDLIDQLQSNGDNGDDGNGDNGDDGAPPPPPPPLPPPDFKAPTSMMVSIIPNPPTMGNVVVFSIISDGYNYDIVLHAEHLGSGESIEVPARLIDDSPALTLAQQLSTPGYWQFWATSDVVNSNKLQVVVQGIKIVVEPEIGQRSVPSGIVKGYGHYVNPGTNIAYLMYYTPDGDWTREVYAGPLVLNEYGYGETYSPVDWTFLTVGHWEWDLRVYSDSARNYPFGTDWIQIVP